MAFLRRNVIGLLVLKVAALTLLALALVAFTACGGSSGETAAAGGDTVHVALNEWSITPAHGGSLEASAGDVLFEIHNWGVAPHDLKIIKSDLAADALPVSDGVVDQDAAGEAFGGVDAFPSGEIRVETFDLEAGRYVLICSIPGHYQQGMSAELTVP